MIVKVFFIKFTFKISNTKHLNPLQTKHSNFVKTQDLYKH